MDKLNTYIPQFKGFCSKPDPQDYPIVTGAVQEVHFKQGFSIDLLAKRLDIWNALCYDLYANWATVLTRDII